VKILKAMKGTETIGTKIRLD